jgi:uncharacterized RmlC-like cupin family protein
MTAVPGQCKTCHPGMITTHAAHTGGTQHTLTTEATCTTCHSATPRVRPTAAMMGACTSCHGNKQINHPSGGPDAWACIDCHTEAGNADIYYIIENGCTPCHGWEPSVSYAVGMHSGGSQTAVLTVSKTNSTYGSVSSSPTGISCGATCSGPSTAAFDVGSVVRLTASASTGKTVSSLTCTGGTTATCGGTSCYSDVTIASGGNSCTAAFSDAAYAVKRVSGAVDSYYMNLADGLNAAVNGDIFYLRGIIFNETVIYDKTDVTATLMGGYDDSSFTLRSGTTLIGGSGRSLTIRGGTVIVDGIVIY